MSRCISDELAFRTFKRASKLTAMTMITTIRVRLWCVSAGVPCCLLKACSSIKSGLHQKMATAMIRKPTKPRSSWSTLHSGQVMARLINCHALIPTMTKAINMNAAPMTRKITLAKYRMSLSACMA